jgi:hypothetical protein
MACSQQQADESRRPAGGLAGPRSGGGTRKKTKTRVFVCFVCESACDTLMLTLSCTSSGAAHARFCAGLLSFSSRRRRRRRDRRRRQLAAARLSGGAPGRR